MWEWIKTEENIKQPVKKWKKRKKKMGEGIEKKEGKEKNRSKWI